MKRWSLSGIALVITLSLFTPAIPVAAAHEDLDASGPITGISESYEKPAGDSGRIVVISRSIYGTFASGGLLGDFVMTYKANVELATQAGNFSGTMTRGPYVFNVWGKSDPVQWIPVPDSPGAYIGRSTASGSWDMASGGNSAGTFTTVLIFVPTAEGHIASILPGSNVTMTGLWKTP